MKNVYTDADQIDFSVSDIPQMPAPSHVLMVRPTHYDIKYVINPHMSQNIGGVDKMQALNEWKHLFDGFEELGFRVKAIEGLEDLPDMVFCANQSLPYVGKDGRKGVLMSIMNSEYRKPEVKRIQKYFEDRDYEIQHLNGENDESFEGMGDALWHFKKRLIWGGYGFRTSAGVYEEISEKLDAPVIALELVDDKFYHLDTCMSVLSEQAAMIYTDAFTETGLEMIYKLFDTVIEASKYEAESLFAVNATCLDGKNVLIQQGCTDINKKLRDAGFSVHEYSTYEFIKSGGSVFCMKLLYW
jgi:N-dimethylarginine dimethylaminohydrolase